MRLEVLALALIVGACNWAFRYVPTRANLHELPSGSPVTRFLAATGPAAIGTLFVASALPLVNDRSGPATLTLGTGVGAVLLIYAATRSVAVATLAGALAYGGAFWLVAA
ncbi:AzlD domain-containing protein [Frigidibacter sp. SD6-1]|uniref:AzlD domain-containing protein n=1 Tax=Frigidibacter sp. SD6-1 TaxID=3032581 RepID=UPI0024DF6F8B|nr:AzlD domain-containing protein [Frigidibacter sp. SD6-1]